MSGQVFRFYHDQLPDDNWRDFYNKAEAAVRAYAPKLFYPRLLSKQPQDYSRVLMYVYSDHPEMFYFNSYGCKVYIVSSFVTIDLCYCESGATMQRKIAEVNRAADRILAECFPEGIEKASELKREKKIFDWLTNHVVYDHTSLEQYSKRMDILGDAWTVYGALVLRRAVCQGIACAFKLLCDRMNMPSLVVVGTAGGRHAWNIVRISGYFYQVDVTWLLKNSISLKAPFRRYEYLNITDEIMGRSHTPDDAFLPKCTSLRSNPYWVKGLCCKDLAGLTALALKYAASSEDRFAFLCLAGYPNEREQAALHKQVAQAAGSTVQMYTDKNSWYIGFEILRRH